MTPLNRMITSERAHLAAGTVLAILMLFFALAHLTAFRTKGNLSLLIFCAAEMLVATFFVLRSQPRTFTTKPVEWVIAIAGTFLHLFLRPTDNVLVPGSELGMVLGSILQIAGVVSLNRSYALVPALRKVKTGGMYQFVRHPIYFSYLITLSSYLAANFSPTNLLILISTITLLVLRIQFEEKQLRNAPEYRAYQTRVKWRLVPYVF